MSTLVPNNSHFVSSDRAGPTVLNVLGQSYHEVRERGNRVAQLFITDIVLFGRIADGRHLDVSRVTACQKTNISKKSCHNLYEKDLVKVKDYDMVYIGIRKNHTSQKDLVKVKDYDIGTFGQYFEQCFVLWLVHYITRTIPTHVAYDRKSQSKEVGECR